MSYCRLQNRSHIVFSGAPNSRIVYGSFMSNAWKRWEWNMTEKMLPRACEFRMSARLTEASSGLSGPGLRFDL